MRCLTNLYQRINPTINTIMYVFDFSTKLPERFCSYQEYLMFMSLFYLYYSFIPLVILDYQNFYRLQNFNTCFDHFYV
jgi:hypothetical protein